MNLLNLFEDDSRMPNPNYAEELAYQIFKAAPNLDTTGAADEVLDYAYDLVVNDFGKTKANALFAYDEDFDSDLVNAYLDLQMNQQAVDEGWKEKLAGAALAGTMALGAGGAHARVVPGADPDINRLTGKPIATQQATDTAPARAEAPRGFSKEYLQQVVNGTHPRPMISVEKAQQLLSNMQEGKVYEADPRNFDSDEDYYAALNAPAKRRSAPSDYPYSPEEDDAYFREIFRKKREAAKKAAQDKESGVAEGASIGPTIKANKIYYADHVVILDPAIYNSDPALYDEYVRDIAGEDLDPQGDAKYHKYELDRINNDGSWTVRKLKSKGVAESRMSELDAEYEDYKKLSPREFFNMYRITKQAWLAKYKSMLPQQPTVEGQEVDASVVIGKLYDVIDHAEDIIKNADYDRQVQYATILRDRATKALNMIKQGGNSPEAALDAFAYMQSGQQGVAEATPMPGQAANLGAANALAASAPGANAVAPKPTYATPPAPVATSGSGEWQYFRPSDDHNWDAAIAANGYSKIPTKAGAIVVNSQKQPVGMSYMNGSLLAPNAQEWAEFVKRPGSMHEKMDDAWADEAIRVGTKMAAVYPTIIAQLASTPFKMIAGAAKAVGNAVGIREADKKKEDDLEPQIKDVALQRAISRAKADFPTAGSGIEALSKDFMRSQDQDQKSFDQLRQAERKQDQMLGQIAKIDQEQEQEIKGLENQNSTLASRLQQLQNVNGELEKKLAAMSGRKAEKKSKTDTAITPAVAPTASEPELINPATKKAAKTKSAAPKSSMKSTAAQLAAPKADPMAAMTQRIQKGDASIITPKQQALPFEPSDNVLEPTITQQQLDPRFADARANATDVEPKYYADIAKRVASSPEKFKAAMSGVRENNDQEAKYNDKYQDMVARVGQKAREQEKSKPVDIKDLARRLAAIEASRKD